MLISTATDSHILAFPSNANKQSQVTKFRSLLESFHSSVYASQRLSSMRASAGKKVLLGASLSYVVCSCVQLCKNVSKPEHNQNPEHSVFICLLPKMHSQTCRSSVPLSFLLRPPDSYPSVNQENVCSALPQATSLCNSNYSLRHRRSQQAQFTGTVISCPADCIMQGNWPPHFLPCEWHQYLCNAVSVGQLPSCSPPDCGCGS